MGVFCVNTKSKEFKETAKRLNIHPDSLEVYVHLFQNSVEANDYMEATDELPFPSDDQIREYFSLGNRESGTQAINAWVEKYGATDGFISNSMLDDAIKDYGTDAVHTYADYNGNTVHKVSRPEITTLKEAKYLLQKLNIIDNNDSLLGISMDRFYERINNLAIPTELASQVEMDIIKQQAIVDNTFMKAPNGKSTNLTEKQWLQVRTKAFKDWFGDWKNNPNEASKVIDENGEPLVVYQGSYSPISESAFYTSNPNVANTYRIDPTLAHLYEFTEQDEISIGYLKSGFLNIKTPKVVEGNNQRWDSLQNAGEKATTDSLYNNYKEVIVKNVFDVGYITITDNNSKQKYLSDIFIGDDFLSSRENRTLPKNMLEAVYTALQKKGLIRKSSNYILRNEKKKELKSKVNNGEITEKESNLILKNYLNQLIKDGNYEWILTLGTDLYTEIQKPLVDAQRRIAYQNTVKEINNTLKQLGVEESFIQFNDQHLDKGIVVLNIDNKLAEQKFEEVISEKVAAVQVLQFLSEKTGLQYKEVTSTEAKGILGRKTLPNINAFVKGNTCYFIKGKKFNSNIAAEEMLHPFIAAIHLNNLEAFNSLLKDAEKTFPQLAAQIRASYKDNVYEEEVVTQSLARAFTKDIEDNPEGHSIRELLKNFIDAVIGFFRSNIGESYIDTPFTRWQEILDKKSISSYDLQNTIKIQDLAQIINSNLQLQDASFIRRTAENKETEDNIKSALDIETEKWDTIFQEHEDKIEFIEDSHEYYFYPKGKNHPESKVKMDTSVTTITNPVDRKYRDREKDGLDWLDVSSTIGSSADKVVRDYFMGIDITARKYPNFTIEQLKTLAKDLANFKGHLDNVVGKDVKYKIVTNPFSVVGKITKYNGSTQTFGGTLDILIYDENGFYYIYDIKTSRNDLRNRKETLEHYTSQVNMYREAIEAMHPELKGSCGGLGILQLNTFYATPKNLKFNGSTGTTMYTVDSRKQLQADGVSIEVHDNYKAPHFIEGDPQKATIKVKEVTPEQYYLDGRHKPVTVSVLDEYSKKETISTTTAASTNTIENNINRASKDKDKRAFMGRMSEQELQDIIEGNLTTLERPADSKALDYYKQLNEGDLLELHTQDKSRSILVKVAKPMTKKGSSYQMKFEYVDGSDTGSIGATTTTGGTSRIKDITISYKKDKENYKKGTPQKHKDTAYLFTENAQAHAAINREEPIGPKGFFVITNVNAQGKNANNFNQADIRTDADGKKTRNAFGIIVKKYQQKSAREWVKQEGGFKDTDADFKLFKRLNTEMFEELENSDYTKMVFPFEIALGKAALPKRFTEWLQKEFQSRYGIVTAIEENKTTGYKGYGLRVKEVQKPLTPASETQEEYDDNENDKIESSVSTKPEITTISEAAPSENLYSDYEKKLIAEREALNALREDKESLFKPSELSDLAKACMFLVSDFISDISTSKDNNEKYFKYLADQNKAAELMDIDFTQMDRIDIMHKLGMYAYYVIRDRYFNTKNNPNGGSLKRSTRKRLETIYQNFNAFLEMGEAVVAKLENVIINGNTAIQIMDESTAQIFEGESAETISEIAGSSAEHWQVSFRQVSAHASLSQLIKRTIGTLFDLNEKGEKKLNDFGIPRRIKESLAVNQILQWTQGAENLSQMVAILKDKKANNPWVQQLIDKLDESSSDETFKSQFWSNFKKYFQPYIIQYQKEIKDALGKVVSSILTNKVINQRGLEKQMVEDFQALWQSREEEGTLMVLYNADGTINEGAVKILGNSLETLKKYIDDNTESQDVQAGTGVKAAISNIYGLFEIELNEDTLEGLSDYNIVKDIYQHALYIKTRKGLDLAIKNKTKDLNLVEKHRGDLEALFSHIVDNSTTTLESVSYEDGKLHYSYVTPSYLSNLVDKLKGNVALDEKSKEVREEAYQKFLEYNYGKYPWFKQGEQWRNEWLRLLAENDEFRKEFQHAVVLTTRPVGSTVSKGYRDKSPMLYAKSMLQNYFYGGKNSQWAFYRIPIMSNKPSEEYLRFKRYITDTYKDDITELLVNVALQEIDRIATVRERKSDDDTIEIKNFDKNGSKFLFLDYLQPILEEYLNWHNKEVNKEKTIYYNEYEDGEIENIRLFLGQMLEQRIQGGDSINTDNLERFEEVLTKVIKEEMNNKFEEYLDDMKKEGLLEQGKKTGKYIHLSDLEMLEGLDTIDSLENFFWNDTFAAINILQLTVTDIAYYKNAEDLQKRLAQIHAPGLKGNSQAKWNGQTIMDGKTRTIYIADFDIVVSDAIENIKQVFESKAEKLEQVNPKEAAQFMEQSKHIIEAFENINVTDAQGYNSPTSYRKKAIAFGKWDDKLEEVYQKIKEGKYETRDLEVMMQPLKPFIYSNATKESVGRLDTLKVGMQNKNSEYLLLMMDAILQGDTNTESPTKSKLSAIYQVMEESHYDREGNYKTDGIDTVQFNSTVKAGEMGVIDINNAATTQQAKKMIEAAIYNDGIRGNSYNLNSVHELEFEDYCIQNEVPAHLEGQSIFGSQMRILSVSDMPEMVNGVEQFITYRGKPSSIREVKQNYMKAIADNIQESLDEIIRQFNIGGTRAERNVALSRLLQEQIKGDSRFGYDLLYSVSTDENGNFNIPLSDPINAGRVQQLLHSIIKSRINKQRIEGGPVVQVTNFGTSKELDIVFKDKDDNKLDTLREWFAKQDFSEYGSPTYEEFAIMHRYKKAKEGTREYDLYHNTYLPLRNIISDRYKSEVASKQAGIAYIECYAPSTVFKQFADEDGFIDFDEIPDEMKEIIGFRIPTEFKYSMVPLRIVGLLPIEAGEGIMLPKDITTLSGSDFDVDKLYIIRPVVKLDYFELRQEYKKLQGKKYDVKALWDDIYDTYPQLDEAIEQAQKEGYRQYQEAGNTGSFKDYLEYMKSQGITKKHQWLENAKDVFEKVLQTWENIDDYVIDNGIQMSFKDFVKSKKGEAKYYKKVINPNNKDGRDNIIFDTIWSMLTSEQAMDQIFTPGNFDEPKKYGYMAEAIRLHPEMSYEEINKIYEDAEKEEAGSGVEALKDLIAKSKNLVYNNIHIAFHKQNMVAGKLIGIFAQNNVSHSIISLIDQSPMTDDEGNIIKDVTGKPKLWRPAIYIKDALLEIEGDIIGDGEVSFDALEDKQGRRISNTLAAFLAASVDAVKDPVLNFMNINETTAGILTSLVRMGYDTELAMLFLTQPIIRDIISKYAIQSEEGHISLSDLIDDTINQLNDNNIDLNSLTLPSINKQDLIKTLREATAEENINLLRALKALDNISRVTSAIVSITKFNSVTAAAGPMLSNTILMKQRVFDSLPIDGLEDSGMPELRTASMIHALNNPIIKAFRDAEFDAVDKLFTNMMLQATPQFDKIIKRVQSTIAGRLDDSMVNKLSEFYLAFLLASTENPIFKTKDNNNPISEKRRTYIYKSLPWEIKKLQKTSDNRFLKLLRVMPADESHEYYWLKINTRGMDGSVHDTVGLYWQELYQENPELAMKLIEYNFITSGLGFTPNSFANLIPVALKRIIPNYIQLLNPSRSLLNDIEVDRLIDQFIRNNYSDDKMVKSIRKTKNKKSVTFPSGRDYILIDSDEPTIIKRTENEKEVYHDYILFNKGTLYKKVSTKGGKVKYQEVSKLGGEFGEILEINPSGEVSPIDLKPKKKGNKQEEKKKLTKEEREDANARIEAMEEDTEESSKKTRTPVLNKMVSQIQWFILNKVPKAEQNDRVRRLRAALAARSSDKDAPANALTKLFKDYNNGTYNKKAFKQMTNIGNVVYNAIQGLRDVNETQLDKIVKDILGTEYDLNLCD